MNLNDRQSREIASIALKNLQDQEITDAQSPRELARENPYQFINEICNVTLNLYSNTDHAISHTTESK